MIGDQEYDKQRDVDSFGFRSSLREPKMIEGPYSAKRSRRISEYGNAFELIYLIIAFSLGCYFVGSLDSNYFFVGGLRKQAVLVIFAALVIGSLMLEHRFWRLVGMTIFVALALFIRYVAS